MSSHLVIGAKGWAHWQHTVVQIVAKLALFALMFKAAPDINNVLFFGICFALGVCEGSNFIQGKNRAEERWVNAILGSTDNNLTIYIDESRKRLDND